jgi:hypothetical protein
MKFECTEEEFILLASMADSTFPKADKESFYTDLARSLLYQCNISEALTFFMANISAIKRQHEKPFLMVPLEEVPLHLNDPSRTRQLLVKWRLTIGR